MDNLYKGYVPTKNKKCLMSFKNNSASELMTYDEVKNMSEFAGILSEDTILIDIDDMDQSEILFKIVREQKLKCRVYKATRGYHFLFKNEEIKNCSTHCKLAIGLTADIKVGFKNSYEVLKFNGEERVIIYDTEEYELVPSHLYPVRTTIDFLNLKSGDGRNQSLFNYILTLQSSGRSKDEIKECIRLIQRLYILQIYQIGNFVH